jgi:exodeoxyribonuclease V alpha subunit
LTNKLFVWFEATENGSPPRPFNPVYLSDCETVFAMTIHKSQGSEFEKVMVVLPDQVDSPLLTRELLYTGITRAKKAVVIRGTAECLMTGISKQVERISGLKTRLG